MKSTSGLAKLRTVSVQNSNVPILDVSIMVRFKNCSVFEIRTHFCSVCSDFGHSVSVKKIQTEQTTLDYTVLYITKKYIKRSRLATEQKRTNRTFHFWTSTVLPTCG